MILNLWETINKGANNFKEWIITNGTNNPFLWVCMFFLGILVFVLTYNALHKDR